MRRSLPIITALLALLITAACVLSPGKFSSELIIEDDRDFTFRYQGEVYALDPERSLGAALPGGTNDANADKANNNQSDASDSKDAKYRAMADSFLKEKGVRKMKYLGDGKFELDYEISGSLDHSFIFPFNTDAEVIVPFLAIEVRNDGTARIKAPGFVGARNLAADDSMPKTVKGKAEGRFTVKTDATVLMHNSEAGLKRQKNMNILSWDISPLTKDSPAFSIKFDD